MNDTRPTGCEGLAGCALTVLGAVPASELGWTLPHEHLLSDVSSQYSFSTLASYCETARPGGSSAGAEGSSRVVADFVATARRMLPATICAENYDWIRRYGLNWDNVRLDDEAEAARELGLYRAAGGRTIVDSTPWGIGRNPAGLARISKLTDVNIIMGCGWYTQDTHPSFVAAAGDEELCRLICSDVLEGDRETGARAGIIGEIGLSWPLHADEEKVLRAAVGAQVHTGAALQIHPGRHEQAPLQALGIVRAAGGRVDRTIISHVERTLFRLDDMLELAATGCYLEFDLFGQESSFYPWAPIDLPNDAGRIDYLIGLIEAGHLYQLLVSHDIYQKVYRQHYGGPGYAHILNNVVPVMFRKGMTENHIREITVGNPGRALAFEEAPR